MQVFFFPRIPIVYTWVRKEGRMFEPGTTFSDNNRVITITNATLEAEGNYICTADGKGGVTSQVITLSMEGRRLFFTV